MENSNAVQRSKSNSQRNGYSQRKGQGSWSESHRRFGASEQENDKSQAGEDINTSTRNSVQKTFKTFRDLMVWQKGVSLVKTVYQKTASFPKEELYGLVTQMRRAAISVPSNIAEGYRRKHAKEFQQFLNVSLGSIGELETQVILAGELNYLSDENKGFLLGELDHLVRMTVSLCNKVQR